MSANAILKCPVCGEEMAVPESAIDGKVLCPYCGVKFIWCSSEARENAHVGGAPNSVWKPPRFTKRDVSRIVLLLAGAYFAFVTGMLFERRCSNLETDRLWRDVADSAHKLEAIETALQELRQNLEALGLEVGKGGKPVK